MDLPERVEDPTKSSGPSRSFMNLLVSHERDFIYDMQALPRPPMCSTARISRIHSLNSPYWAPRPRARAPALHWDCDNIQNTCLTTTELIVWRVEGGRIYLKEEQTELLEENKHTRTWHRAWHVTAAEQKRAETNWAGSGLRAGIWGRKHLWIKGTLGNNGENFQLPRMSKNGKKKWSFYKLHFAS